MQKKHTHTSMRRWNLLWKVLMELQQNNLPEKNILDRKNHRSDGNWKLKSYTKNRITLGGTVKARLIATLIILDSLLCP